MNYSNFSARKLNDKFYAYLLKKPSIKINFEFR